MPSIQLTPVDSLFSTIYSFYYYLIISTCHQSGIAWPLPFWIKNAISPPTTKNGGRRKLDLDLHLPLLFFLFLFLYI